MEKRTRHRRSAILLAIIALPVTVVVWKYVTLRSYQSFIHKQYAPEIMQLELAMQNWPEDRFEDETTYQRVEALHEKLNQTFSVDDFYCASWSFDSHHGLKGTGIPGSGFSTYPWITTTDNLRQSLYFGKSFEGVPLLVYQRWLPNSPVMRHIQIVFYRNKVKIRMKDPRPANIYMAFSR